MSCVITCFKSVVDENDISIGSDQSVSFQRAQRKISDYEKNVIEAGNQLAGKLGADHVCLTFAPEGVSQQIKDALSRGPVEAIIVEDANAEAMTVQTTGKVLAAAIKNREDVACVICGDGSSDVYQKQTGARVAAALGWPYIGNAIAIEPEGDALLITQKADGVTRRLRVKGPCVIAALPELAEAKTPGMRDILAAKKKQQSTFSLADLGVSPEGNVAAEDPKGFVMERKNVMLEGTPEEAVAALVDSLKKEGVL